ncbi:dynein assembly factor 4, axonemal [Salarias fasciatus]|uniref:Dynein assembly factor 4, axonemal-like n=1 Tax=Salarias fasciatus TaxID=181472 RepID=A0A672I0C9_SALFA|nr:dynein assembly factor 4, axonemal-like [Salarias fasciatus]
MPRKKAPVKVGKIRENSRLMQTHESMVDYLSGRSSMTSFMDVFAPNFLGLNFLKPLEDDLLYSDEDEDYYDDEDDGLMAADRPLAPHPQIKQLTDEEAEKISKELLQEEERRKDKTEKNKRKKMRKKEKKRLEKENAVKDNLPEEEQVESDSLENHKDSAIIDSYPKVNKPSPGDKSQNAIEAAGGDETGSNGSNDKKGKEKKKKEEKDLDLQNSHVSSGKSVPEETYNLKPTGEPKKKNNTSLKVQQPEEIKAAAEKPAVQKKGESDEISKEKTLDSTDVLAKRSREFANIGNRLAASGEYEKAVSYFTDAIKCNPKELKLFGNRSLCYERIQQYENALQDADVALSMEPNWIKGLFRKGKALCGLKRYFEASLIYQKVLELESTSSEATQELKRAQTLHLMELGFNWAQSTEALKTHATLEEAVEALFAANRYPAAVEPSAMEEEADEQGGWTVLQASRSRTQQVRESGEGRSKSHSPTPRPRNQGKPELFPVWVGTLSPTMTYTRLHELFSRTGTVYSIKMLLEQQCAFVNYTKQEDCERAIKLIHGMLVDGAPLTVRYPFKVHTELGVSKSAATDASAARPGTYKKECFFWRTSGCTRQDCTFRHVPENKNIDREKFTSGLGWNQK